ncbi:ragulator complex protein LAMTOR1 [Arapaima gigas]
MGSCCSNGTEDPKQDPDQKRLILQSEGRVGHGGEQGSTNHQHCYSYEDKLFISIPAKMAKTIINISTVDSPGMKQDNCMNRVRQYRTKLAALSGNMMWRSSVPLPTLTSEPYQVLSAHLVPSSDLQQVSKVAAYACSGVLQVRVEVDEEVVVQFAVS